LLHLDVTAYEIALDLLSKLGRPKGKAVRLKLDDIREDIEKYYKMGLSLREIGKLLNIASSTLSDYIKIREITR
jgi:DNA-binding NarL/FixJ family response regulator